MSEVATRRRASSPAVWPLLSLMALSPSTSMAATLTGRPWRKARDSSRSRSRSSARRLPTPVSGSRNAASRARRAGRRRAVQQLVDGLVDDVEHLDDDVHRQAAQGPGAEHGPKGSTSSALTCSFTATPARCSAVEPGPDVGEQAGRQLVASDQAMEGSSLRRRISASQRLPTSAGAPKTRWLGHLERQHVPVLHPGDHRHRRGPTPRGTPSPYHPGKPGATR